MTQTKPILDFSLIDDIEFDGIHFSDWPDMSDAFICRCCYDGREATEDELDIINDDGSFVYEALMDHLF